MSDVHIGHSHKSGLSVMLLQQMIEEGHKILFIDCECGLINVGTPGHIDHDTPIEESVARLPESPESPEVEELRDTDRDPYYLQYTKRRKKK